MPTSKKEKPRTSCRALGLTTRGSTSRNDDPRTRFRTSARTATWSAPLRPHSQRRTPTCVHSLTGNERDRRSPTANQSSPRQLRGARPAPYPPWFIHMLMSRSARFEETPQRRLITNISGIIDDVFPLTPGDHKRSPPARSGERDALRQLETTFAHVLGLTRLTGRMKPQNATEHRWGQLTWEEDRRAETHPLTLLDRISRFATAPAIPWRP